MWKKKKKTTRRFETSAKGYKVFQKKFLKSFLSNVTEKWKRQSKENSSSMLASFSCSIYSFIWLRFVCAWCLYFAFAKSLSTWCQAFHFSHIFFRSFVCFGSVSFAIFILLFWIDWEYFFFHGSLFLPFSSFSLFYGHTSISMQCDLHFAFISTATEKKNAKLFSNFQRWRRCLKWADSKCFLSSFAEMQLLNLSTH